MSDRFEEFLLEQLRAKDKEIARLRVLLEVFQAEMAEMAELGSPSGVTIQ